MSTHAPAEQIDIGSLRPRGHLNGALKIHPYFGRIDPALAQVLIYNYSRPGARVLDPFCGSGTVLHEAVTNHRAAIGWDSSPLAVGISLAKLSSPSNEEVASVTRFADNLVSPDSADDLLWDTNAAGTDIPAMPRVQSVSSWFSDVALRELAVIRGRLLRDEHAMTPVSRLLAWIAFSRIVTKASNQQSESSYRRVEKSHEHGDVLQLFLSSTREVCRAAASLSPVLGHRLQTSLGLCGGTFSWAGQSATVAVRDSRTLPDCTDPVDLVVTSPPYLMAWDYGLYHKFRFYWLGLDLDGYEGTEIGRHLRRQNDDVERYCADMTQTFAVLRQVVSKRGTIAMINSPSAVHGELVDTNALLEQCGMQAGWHLREISSSLPLTGPHHGMYASLSSRRASAPGQAGKQEHVLIFQRGRR